MTQTEKQQQIEKNQQENQESIAEQIDNDLVANSKEEVSSSSEIPQEEDPASIIEKLQNVVNDYDDRYKRLFAEFENYKKRTQQELASRLKFASQPLVLSLLPAVDSLERAIIHAREATDDKSLTELLKGVEMVQQQFIDSFKKYNIEQIEALHKKFDPSFHEAMGMVDSDEVEPDHVANVLQTGYLMFDRVIRPAMVQIVKKAN